MAPCGIRYSEKRSRNRNIPGGEGLYSTKYLVSKCLKQMPNVKETYKCEGNHTLFSVKEIDANVHKNIFLV